MKKLRNVGLVLMAVVMMTAFAACGSDNDKNAASPEKSPVESVSPEVKDADAELESPLVSDSAEASESPDASESAAVSEQPSASESTEASADAADESNGTETSPSPSASADVQ